VWGITVTVLGGTTFFSEDRLPPVSLDDYDLHEVLTGESPVKEASYSFFEKQADF
jgi:hypothetical protein